MSDAPLPQAPALQGELLLNVFTHRSLRQEDRSDDNERYAALGEKVFEAAITHCIFLQFPSYRMKEIAEERSKQLSDKHYEQWTTFYRFRDKLRYHPSAREEINTPQGARELFHAYVGGAYTQANGPMEVSTWVYNMVVPPEVRARIEEQERPMSYHPPPPPSIPYPMPPPPPPTVPYPRSRTSSFSSSRQGSITFDDVNGYNTSTTGKVVFLPRFNEICTQRRLSLQYPAEQGGLQHAPRWIVKCLVNGEEKGHGSATTKQLAKEEAAKQAWIALGWPMH